MLFLGKHVLFSTRFGMEDDARAIITFITEYVIDLLLVLMKNAKLSFDNIRFCQYHILLANRPNCSRFYFGN